MARTVSRGCQLRACTLPTDQEHHQAHLSQPLSPQALAPPPRAEPAELVLHTLGKNDSFSLQAAPIIKGGRGFHACPNLPLSKLRQHPARQGRSFEEHSWLLCGSAWHAAPARSSNSVASFLCCCLPWILCCFFLQPSHPPSLGALASLCKWNKKGPKHGKGPASHCPEVKGANCFFLEHAPNFTPFSPQMWETSSNPLHKRVFSHMQIRQVNAHCTAFPCSPQT